VTEQFDSASHAQRRSDAAWRPLSSHDGAETPPDAVHGQVTGSHAPEWSGPPYGGSSPGNQAHHGGDSSAGYGEHPGSRDTGSSQPAPAWHPGPHGAGPAYPASYAEPEGNGYAYTGPQAARSPYNVPPTGDTSYAVPAVPVSGNPPQLPPAGPAHGAGHYDPQPPVSGVSYGAPQPSYGGPQPSYGAAQPSYGAAQPSYGAAQPSYGAAQPSYGAAQSSYGPAPSYDAAQSSSGAASQPLVSGIAYRVSPSHQQPPADGVAYPYDERHPYDERYPVAGQQPQQPGSGAYAQHSSSSVHPPMTGHAPLPSGSEVSYSQHPMAGHGPLPSGSEVSYSQYPMAGHGPLPSGSDVSYTQHPMTGHAPLPSGNDASYSQHPMAGHGLRPSGSDVSYTQHPTAGHPALPSGSDTAYPQQPVAGHQPQPPVSGLPYGLPQAPVSSLPRTAAGRPTVAMPPPGFGGPQLALPSAPHQALPEAPASGLPQAPISAIPAALAAVNEPTDKLPVLAQPALPAGSTGAPPMRTLLGKRPPPPRVAGRAVLVYEPDARRPWRLWAFTAVLVSLTVGVVLGQAEAYQPATGRSSAETQAGSPGQVPANVMPTAPTGRLTVPLGTATARQLEVAGGTAVMRIRIADLGDTLLTADPLDQTMTAQFTENKASSRLEVVPTGAPPPAGASAAPGPDGAAALPSASAGAEVVLNAKVAWTLEVTGTATDLNIDSRPQGLAGLEVSGATTRTVLQLPQPKGTVPLTVSGAVGDLTVRTEGGAPVRVRLAKGAEQATIAGKVTKAPAAGRTLSEQGWKAAKARYDVKANGAVKNFLVEHLSPGG
jgi:hypothetical protein